MIWIGVVDYGRIEWRQVEEKAKKCPTTTEKLKELFINRHCEDGVMAEMVGDRPQWSTNGPVVGFVYQPKESPLEIYFSCLDSLCVNLSV